MRYLNSSFTLFVLKILGAVCSFIVSVVFLQFSMPEMLGKFALATTVVGVAVIVVTFGQNVIVMRLLTNDDEAEKDSYLTRTFFYCFILFVLFLPVFFLLISFIFPQAAIFFLLLFSYNVVAQLKSSILMVEKRFLLNSICDDFLRPFWSVAYVVISLGGALLLSSTEEAFKIAAVLMAFPLVYSIYSMIKILNIKQELLGFNDFAKNFWIFLSVGLPVVLVALLGVLISQFDRVYVTAILGYSAAGVYYAAQTLVLVINYFNQALISKKISSMVAIYQRNEIKSLEGMARNNAWMSFGFSLLAIIAYIVAFPIIEAVFNISGSEFFWVSIVLLCMQSVSLLFGFGSTMMLYSGKKDQRVLAKYLLSSFLVGAVIGAALVFKYGIVGAAFGTGIGVLLNRLLPYFYFKKQGYSLGVF